MKGDFGKRFEQFLYRNDSLSNSKEFWDKKSADFAAAFSNIDKNRDNILFDTIERERLLKDVRTVVDVGCGVGRHAYYFSPMVERYLGIDISSRMIEFANENKEKYGLDNCDFKETDWRVFEEKFDLVLASMNPSINTIEDIERLIDLSNRYVLIKRFISDTDSLIYDMKLPESIAHNNPAYVYGMINIFWRLGFVPQVFTGEEIKEDEYTFDEAIRKYESRFNKLSESEKSEKINLLKEIEKKEGKIISVKNRRYSLILVDKMFRNGRLDRILKM